MLLLPVGLHKFVACFYFLVSLLWLLSVLWRLRSIWWTVNTSKSLCLCVQLWPLTPVHEMLLLNGYDTVVASVTLCPLVTELHQFLPQSREWQSDILLTPPSPLYVCVCVCVCVCVYSGPVLTNIQCGMKSHSFRPQATKFLGSTPQPKK